MKSLILKLCTGRWLSRKQLSELLNRNPESLLSRFLTPMVDHGLLVMKFPDKPNRIDQAYRAAQDEIILQLSKADVDYLLFFRNECK